MAIDERHVVTVFLRRGGAVLLVRRSDAVGEYSGRWAGISGYVEGAPEDALGNARRELAEKTGTDPTLVRAGDPVEVVDEEIDRRWIVHPFLFDADDREVDLGREATGAEWVAPPAIIERETVPGLWTAYERVAPTVERLRSDREHGAAYLSTRALEVLRDRAARRRADGELAWAPLAELARQLRDARPGLRAIVNRVNRAMHEADGDPGAVRPAAGRGIERALNADEEAAASAAARLTGPLLTLSRSGTVRATVDAVDPGGVYVTESRPGGEGIPVAEAFAGVDDPESGADAGATEGAGVAERTVTLLPDAAVAHALAETDIAAVVVGADAVLPDGRVVNKVGTRGAALAAADADVPVYAVTSRDKVTPEPADPDLEPRPREEMYDGPAALSVLAPTFDVTPADRVSVICEDGRLATEAVREVAQEHRHNADWPGAGGDASRADRER